MHSYHSASIHCAVWRVRRKFLVSHLPVKNWRKISKRQVLVPKLTTESTSNSLLIVILSGLLQIEGNNTCLTIFHSCYSNNFVTVQTQVCIIAHSNPINFSSINPAAKRPLLRFFLQTKKIPALNQPGFLVFGSQFSGKCVKFSEGHIFRQRVFQKPSWI